METSEIGWASAIEADDFPSRHPRVPGTDYFTFAAGIFGDPICVECVSSASGKIILFDHETGCSESICLGYDLGEWIGRLIEADGTDFGYMNGAIEGADSIKQRAVFTYHRKLNPGVEWAARGLMRLDYPNGHPAGYHHWTGRELVPLADAGDVTSISLRGGHQSDLESIVAAAKCEKLVLVQSEIQSFSSLSRLDTLIEFSIYEATAFDASVLKSLPRLTTIYATRCTLTNLDQLSSTPSLTRLRADGCRLVEAEWDRLTELRPDIKKTR